MNNMPVPYNGKEKYIFVSYSHKDSHKVLPVISRMIADGYRVWFDQGIDPGSEWDENIAQHINSCGYFAAFISDNYIASGNCCDELSYARDLDKDRLVVYLEQVNLPSGIAMRINRIQSIFMYKYTDQEMFYQKLLSTQNLESCAAVKPKTDAAQPAPQTTSDNKADSVQTGYYTQPDFTQKEQINQAAPINEKPLVAPVSRKKKVAGLITFIIAAALFILSLAFIDVPATGFVLSLFSTVVSFLTFTGFLGNKVLRIMNNVIFGVNLFLGITFAGIGLGELVIFCAVFSIIAIVPLWIMLNIKKYKNRK